MRSVRFLGTGRTVPIAVAACLVLAACTSTTVVRPPVAPVRASVAASPTSIGPVGSHTNPRVLTCQDGMLHEQSNAGARDVTSGPLSYPNAQLLMRPGSVTEFYGGGVPVSPEGVAFYKMGTYVTAGATVTVTVMPQARAYAGLQTPGDPPGAEAVTYQACPNGVATSWVGGFDLTKRKSACLPLEVDVKGEPAPRRLVLSIFNGAC